ILVIHPSVPATSVTELIAVAKARPGTLNSGFAAAGRAVHLSGELFRYMAGIDVVRINYKSSGAAVTALLAGEVHLMFANAPPVAPHVKSVKLKALAVTTVKPSPLFPELP